MDIHYATLETCSAATDTVVVIDVIRAFTTAAFAFAAGAHDIVPVDTVEEALTLRERFPGALVMGGVDRWPPEGFDFGNSPAALRGCDLRGRRMIQRTPNGTQGIVRSVKAKTLLASSFVCARATADYIKRQSPAQVTLVSTDLTTGEDRACAEYIAGLLGDEMPDVARLVERERHTWLQRIRTDVAEGGITKTIGAEFEADLDCCMSLDRFNFAMPVQQQAGLLVMEAVE